MAMRMVITFELAVGLLGEDYTVHFPTFTCSGSCHNEYVDVGRVFPVAIDGSEGRKQCVRHGEYTQEDDVFFLVVLCHYEEFLYLLGEMLVYVVGKLGALFLNYISLFFFVLCNILAIRIFLCFHGVKWVHLGKLAPLAPIRWTFPAFLTILIPPADGAFEVL